MIYDRKGPETSQFVAKGFLGRECFSHRARVIAKQYPDTFLLLEGRGIPQADLQAGRFFQLNLYSDQLTGLPPDLFEDRRVNWHNQQLGHRGLIASAGLYLRDQSLVITVMQSDLCQQLYRHPEYSRTCKTQVEKRFGYWHRILFNAILDYALECGVAAVHCPTSAWIVGATRKAIRPDLFRRIYDSPQRHYQTRRVLQGRAEYWEVPLADNADAVVRLGPAPPDPPREPRRLICVLHDVEEDVDTRVPATRCRQSLSSMLATEKDCGVAATYNVLGTLFRGKEDEIRDSDPRHSLAFHSYNHDVSDPHQLERCREIDLQVRGYRPPRSIIGPDLTDYRLSFLNFEWLASSERSLGLRSCTVWNGIVRIPIAMDDYPLATRQQEYRQWEDDLLEAARNRAFFAFGLHDCYARWWLDSYAALLDQLSAIGDLVTCDAICDRILWEQAAASDAHSPAAPTAPCLPQQRSSFR
jgi:hypothetical protein